MNVVFQDVAFFFLYLILLLGVMVLRFTLRAVSVSSLFSLPLTGR